MHKAKCLKCNNFFINHRYMNQHMKVCKGQRNQNTVVTLSFLPEIPTEITNLSQLHESIKNTFVLANISFNQIDNPIFRQLFLNLGVD